jgi:hypothetical protein
MIVWEPQNHQNYVLDTQSEHNCMSKKWYTKYQLHVSATVDDFVIELTQRGWLTSRWWLGNFKHHVHVVKNTDNLYLLSFRLVDNIRCIIRNYKYFGYAHAQDFNVNKNTREIQMKTLKVQ